MVMLLASRAWVAARYGVSKAMPRTQRTKHDASCFVESHQLNIQDKRMPRVLYGSSLVMKGEWRRKREKDGAITIMINSLRPLVGMLSLRLRSFGDGIHTVRLRLVKSRHDVQPTAIVRMGYCSDWCDWRASAVMYNSGKR